MKKKMIQLAVAAVLLVAAVVVLLVLNRQDDHIEEAPPEDPIYVLGGVPQPFVRSVEVENDAGGFVIENGYENAIQQGNSTDSRYSIPGLDTDTLNSSLLSSVMTAAGNLEAKQVVVLELDAANSALYGLNAPRARVQALYENGSATMLIGGEAPGSEGTYVQAGNTVYLVSDSKLNNLLLGELDFVNKIMTPGNSETSLFERIVLSGAHYSEPITIEKAEDTQVSAVTGLSNYAITSPVQSGADTQDGLAALQAVFGLSASEVVARKDQDLAAYGLDAPWVQADVFPLNDEEAPEPMTPFGVTLSAPDEAGLVYALVSTSPYVYRLPAASLPFTRMTLFDLQEKMILLPYIDSVSEVEVVADGRTYTFALEGESDELSVTLDGRELDTKYFRAFYQTLIAAKYEAEVEPGGDAQPGPLAEDVQAGPEAAAPDAGETVEQPEMEDAMEDSAGDPAEDVPADQSILLQVTYRYRDGSPANVVTFYPGPARRSIVTLDGGREYYALSTYVDRVLQDVQKVAAGEEVTSYL